jgi:hypothetical protein
MDRKQLLELELPSDADRIAALPMPGDQASTDGDVELLQHLRGLWVSLCQSPEVVGDLVSSKEGGSWDSRFWKTFASLAAIYCAAARAAAKAGPMSFFQWMTSESCASPGGPDERMRTTVAAVAALADRDVTPEDRRKRIEAVSVDANRALARSNAALIILNFDQALLPLLLKHALVTLNDGAEDGEGDINLEADAMESLQAFNARVGKTEGFVRERLTFLLDQLLAYGQEVYSSVVKGPSRSAEHAYSQQWLDQLALLSRRDPAVQRRLGAGMIEGQFERHVALLFQTFGFVTVPALSGEAAADLLCIGHAPEKFTLLVDAKSSRRPYFLPKDDQRALAAYTRETTRSLVDLPELKLVLLVGHGPAGTVGAKLEKLEAELGMPMRFVDVEHLTDLRKRQSSPLRLDFFLEALLRGDRVLTARSFDGLRERHSALQETYSSFVRGIRAIS